MIRRTWFISTVMVLVIGTVTIITAATNPYPRTGQETDRSLLIDKHEPAITGLYTNSTDQPVFESTVTGTWVTSISTGTTLDGATYGGYRFELEIYKPAALNGTPVTYLIELNSDTTGTNYSRTYISTNGTTVSTATVAQNVFTASTTANGDLTNTVSGEILISPNGYQIFRFMEHRNQDGVTGYDTITRINTPVGLTNLKITSATANAIGVNSRLRLWRKK